MCNYYWNVLQLGEKAGSNTFAQLGRYQTEVHVHIYTHGCVYTHTHTHTHTHTSIYSLAVLMSRDAQQSATECSN